MTKLTVLHFASPFAYSMPMPRKSLASVRENDDADRVSASGETESGDLSETQPTSGADRVSLLAGDAAPSRSRSTPATNHYDIVLQHYRDLGDENAPPPQVEERADDDPDGSPSA